MSKKYRIIIIVLSAVYVLFHLVTLANSPLPWFDEVSFASITNSFLHSGTFLQEARTVNLDEQASLVYGPVYFVMQAAIIKLFGWKIFAFRFSNFLFGLADLYLLYRICRNFSFEVPAAMLTVALVGMDPSFNQFLHSGRMDYIALFFFFLSFLLFVKTENRRNFGNIFLSVLTGVLLATALLTTPRVLFAFAFYFVYFFYELFAFRKDLVNILIKYLIIGLVCFGIYYLWIYFKFGSLQHYIYKNYTSNQLMKDHIGLGLGELRFNSKLLMYGAAFACCAWLLLSGKGRKNALLLAFSMPVIIMFLLIVGGSLGGRYYALVAPFAAVLIVGTLIHVARKKWLSLPVWALIGIFTMGFLFKGLYVFATWSQRNPATNEQKVSALIKPNTSIAGDFEFYYIALHNNCSFQSVTENGRMDSMLQHFRRSRYDYFIFNKRNPVREFIVISALKDRYVLESVFENKPSNDVFSKLIRKMGFNISEDYSCYIYKYTGEADEKLNAQQP